MGSIPAYAGEPLARLSRRDGVEVYPRVCGGTSTQVRFGPDHLGLSPRMRGNLGERREIETGVGSIPAYAGEPGGPPCRGFRTRVYPRVCGGTARGDDPMDMLWGLSPRMRGNRVKSMPSIGVTGSIPAYAGEPSGSGSPDWIARVYPRVCGGTLLRTQASSPLQGLSPRMRGNPSGLSANGRRYGSIPAYAGEPQPRRRPLAQVRVYPRVCGGTRRVERFPDRHQGLSPRMRGNHDLDPASAIQ